MRTLLALSIVVAMLACARPKTTPPPPPVTSTTPAPPAESMAVDTLRQANARAASGQIDEANRMYLSVIDAPNSAREAVIAAATGLYRTGDYADAVRGFAKLGAFAHGEEDLRYYNAVSLYEVGRYADAKRELACALPFIGVTPDVERYRAKIEAK